MEDLGGSVALQNDVDPFPGGAFQQSEAKMYYTPEQDGPALRDGKKLSLARLVHWLHEHGGALFGLV